MHADPQWPKCTVSCRPYRNVVHGPSEMFQRNVPQVQVDPTPLKVYFWTFFWNFMQVARAIQKLCPRSHIHAYVRTMPGGQVPGMAIDPVMMIVSTQRLRDDDCAVVIMSRPTV